MQQKTRPMKKISLYFSACCLFGVAMFSVVQSLIAGPLTGTISSPATKITVYQGTMAITPGRGSSDTLELGNPGTKGIEITSTGKIYVRPSGVASDHAAWFDTSSSKSDLYVTGKLWINGASVPPWPVSGGTSYWQQASGALQPLPLGSVQRGMVLQEPIANTSGYVDVAALSVTTTGAQPSTVIQNTSGPALVVNGNTYWYGNLQQTGGVATMNGLRVWYPSNDGMNSGLDADFLDGHSLFFSFKTATIETGTTRWNGDYTSLVCPLYGAKCLCSGNRSGLAGCIALDAYIP